MNNLMHNYFVNLNKIKKKINDIKLLGFNTDHLLQELNNIIESINQELNKTNNGNYCNLNLTGFEYIQANKLLWDFESKLNCYNNYFKAYNFALYVKESDLNDENIENIKNEIISILNFIKNTFNINDEKEKNIIENIYEAVYKILCYEIENHDMSEIYDICKEDIISSLYLESILNREIEKIDLDKYPNVKKELHQIKMNGLNYNLFDINLIKKIILKDKEIVKESDETNYDKYINFTILSEKQVFGYNKLDIIKKYGTKCAITDFSILLGGNVSNDSYVDGDISLRGRTNWWYLSSPYYDGKVYCVAPKGADGWIKTDVRFGGVRPVLLYSNIFDIFVNGVREREGLLEVEYGEYPQYVVEINLSRILEDSFQKGILRKTGKTYTTESRKWNKYLSSSRARIHTEYEYNGKKYIRFIGDSNCSGEVLSDGRIIQKGISYWLEVSPLKWIVDERTKILVSKTLIASGIRFCKDKKYRGDFENTEMYQYLNSYFAKDIIPSKNHLQNITNKEKNLSKTLKFK